MRIRTLIVFWIVAFIAITILAYPPMIYHYSSNGLWHGRIFLFCDRENCTLDTTNMLIEFTILAIAATTVWLSFRFLSK